MHNSSNYRNNRKGLCFASAGIFEDYNVIIVIIIFIYNKKKKIKILSLNGLNEWCGINKLAIKKFIELLEILFYFLFEQFLRSKKWLLVDVVRERFISLCWSHSMTLIWYHSRDRGEEIVLSFAGHFQNRIE